MTPSFSLSELNDRFRTTYSGGNVMLTPSVLCLPSGVRATLLERVKSFSSFDEKTDPEGDHRFGTIPLVGYGCFFWKIDYYNRSLMGASEDPRNPTVTARVLTIMHAGEY
jgi:hypothetical protein